MERFALRDEGRLQAAGNNLRSSLSRQLEAGLADACQLRFAAAGVRLLHSASCGKCTPCRTGLDEVAHLFDEAAGIGASAQIRARIQDLANHVAETADCAIGIEAARFALEAADSLAGEFEIHLAEGRCPSNAQAEVPCVGECPARVDIPGYIALLHAGKPEDAVRLIRKDNPLPLTCSLVCEHPCETHCRRGMTDDAVSIRELKRVAVEQAGRVELPEPGPSTGKRVAIVGGGPAGITAAYYLTLMGHYVHILESQPALGGMLRYGIPHYRLPKDLLDEEINQITSLGIDVTLNCTVGFDVPAEQLRDDYDALFVAIGAQGDKKLRLADEGAPGVMSAVKLLRDNALGNAPDLKGKHVVVVGGGNVAMDAARTSIRLGATVDVVYRRRQSDMTAQEDEILGAIAEGCEILDLHAPESIELDENGAVCGLRVSPQVIGPIVRGRASMRNAAAASRTIACDVIVVAIGQSIENEPFKAMGMPVKWDQLVGDANTRVAELDGVFVGGDCSTGPSTVIKAIAAGKAAACAIDEYLGFTHPITVDIDVPERIADLRPCARVIPRERTAISRINDFEVLGARLTDEEAHQESGRCLRCDLHGKQALEEERSMTW